MGILHQAVLVNPGAEDGDATGWTADLNTAPVARTGTPNSGTFYFFIANNSAGAYYQDFDIPASVRSLASLGVVLVNPSMYANDFSGDSDNQRFRIQAWDANSHVVQVQVASGNAGFGFIWTINNGAWLVRSFSAPLHTDAIKIRMYVDGFRATGTELSAYQDDFALNFTSSNTFRYELGLVNPSGYDGNNNWSVISGDLSTSAGKTNGSLLHNPSSFYFLAVNTSILEAEQEVTIPDTHGFYDGIDSGDVDFWLQFAQGSFDEKDAAKMRATFLSGSGTILSSMETAWDISDNFWEVKTISMIVPDLTRSVKVTMIGSRHAGANLDGYITAIQAYFISQSNFINGDNDPFASSGIASARDFPIQGNRDFPSPAGLIRDIPIA